VYAIRGLVYNTVVYELSMNHMYRSDVSLGMLVYVRGGETSVKQHHHTIGSGRTLSPEKIVHMKMPRGTSESPGKPLSVGRVLSPPPAISGVAAVGGGGCGVMHQRRAQFQSGWCCVGKPPKIRLPLPISTHLRIHLHWF
jgi:hypothetical protein